MSMFFAVVCSGKYDPHHYWDDGITNILRPVHRTKTEALGLSGPDTCLDKSVCPPVQEVSVTEFKGDRQVTLLVKAMGYQQAEERARDFCNTWYKPAKTAKSKQLSAKEIFEALPKVIAKGGTMDYSMDYFEFYEVGDKPKYPSSKRKQWTKGRPKER